MTKGLIYLLTVLVAKTWGVVFILQINGHSFHGQNHGKMMR
jgi:hypothetical protein